jgi:menaquinone-dependent protoporphyrinogen oxidase
MARVLIVYGTTEGHTARIADRMATVIRGAGHEVEMHDAKEIRTRAVTGAFDGVIVGGSVHGGDHQSSLRDFVKRNRDLLEGAPSAFFSVSLAAADPDDEAAAEVQAMLDKFSRETGWRPRRVEAIAGALVYTQYNVFIRHLMKLIVRRHGRTELDTSRDYDFTDWEAVERFARDFAATVADGVRGDALTHAPMTASSDRGGQGAAGAAAPRSQ